VPTDAYAVAKLTDGYAFEVLPYEEALSFPQIQPKRFRPRCARKRTPRPNPSDKWKMKTFDESPWVSTKSRWSARR